MIEAIESARIKHAFDVWAYVIMPEHMHLLIFPRRSGYAISPILYAIKKSVANRAITYVIQHSPSFLRQMEYKEPKGISHRFWQPGGGYDRNLWSESHVWETIDYIHANPVRRGLCAHPNDWEWSSARFYAGKGMGPLTITPDHLPRDPRGLRGGF